MTLLKECNGHRLLNFLEEQVYDDRIEYTCQISCSNLSGFWNNKHPSYNVLAYNEEAGNNIIGGLSKRFYVAKGKRIDIRIIS